MALRDQPYFPFYVNDYLTDEKLCECSAMAQGVYIRIMCLMHKSSEYGTILLQQKDKQSEQQIKNFAAKLVRNMPFDVDIIEKSLNELINERVLSIDGDKLLQKRMIRDNDISIKRALSGSKGGFATANKSANSAAKSAANTVNENEYENEDEYINENKNGKTLTERELLFIDEVNVYLEYSELTRKNFITYWTEPNRSKTKMRFELQKTWETKRRLKTWADRESPEKKSKPVKFGRQEVSNEFLRKQMEIELL